MDMEQFEVLNNKLDKLDSRIDNIDLTLVKQSVLLDEHIRRTGIAETNIDMLRADLKPVEKHVSMIQGALKFIALVGVLSGLVVSAIKVISSASQFFH